ncbi:MAG: nucleotide exchange factor GrpE [Gemmatimonadaceae bacterium]|nr:nucleotide exchange factor GrpE [Gemmatimonadaceae bacterium]
MAWNRERTSQQDVQNGRNETPDESESGQPATAGDEVFAADDDGNASGATDDIVAQLQRDLSAERDKNLRLVAEFDNYRKRMLKGMIESESRGQADLVKALLDPLDDIARFAHVDPATTESTTLVEGVEMVEKKLGKSLRAAGLDIVNPAGEMFDPAMHEAVSTDTAESDEEDGTVSRVFQVGYMFKGQLLRPARVVVRQHSDAN